MALKAADAKDKDALFIFLRTNDKAAKICHPLLVSPNEKRAVEACSQAVKRESLF